MAAIDMNTTGASLSIGISQNGLASLQLYQREITTYLHELPRLLKDGHAREYVLIHGDEILGTWMDQSEAITIGRDRFGVEPIFVKKVDPRDPELYAALKNQLGSSCPF